MLLHPQFDRSRGIMRPYRLFSIAIVVLAALADKSVAQATKAPTPDCAKVLADTANHATMNHAAHASALATCAALPTSSGQAAFGAISEIVRMLKEDPNTDWSRVNIEALRQHLIDMDDVTMHAAMVQRNVPGGIEVDVTGSGRTAEAIRRMAVNHSRMLDQGAEYRATAREIQNGARITITAKNVSDANMATQIRGLGFAGIMTEGNHHAPHHLAIARGDATPHGR
jgi:hypothetical protein